jgi:hypothetical protein
MQLKWIKLIYLTIPRILGIKPWVTRKHVDAISCQQIFLQISVCCVKLQRRRLMQPNSNQKICMPAPSATAALGQPTRQQRPPLFLVYRFFYITRHTLTSHSLIDSVRLRAILKQIFTNHEVQITSRNSPLTSNAGKNVWKLVRTLYHFNKVPYDFFFSIFKRREIWHFEVRSYERQNVTETEFPIV